ncbi:cupin domain-containing protein [Streptomyces decoyicus]|uniref:cupin domain-containing protein n=1 Tax=Streptomyces decoyicus TaxID=249567 RepID=UPI00380D84B5
MYPSWIDDLPKVDTTFSGASGALIDSPSGQVVLWNFPEGGVVPPHRHGPQIGIVIAGQVDLEVAGTVTSQLKGDFFTIANDEEHAARVHPGTQVIEIFQEPGRHQARQ